MLNRIHFCPDWDGLRIYPDSQEMSVCNCVLGDNVLDEGGYDDRGDREQ